MQSRIEQLELELRVVDGDIGGLVGYTNALTSRVARMEGFMQGAAAAAPRRPRLPKA